MILVFIVVAWIWVAVLVGVLAKMPPRQILWQGLAMTGAAVVFWGLVQLVLH